MNIGTSGTNKPLNKYTPKDEAPCSCVQNDSRAPAPLLPQPLNVILQQLLKHQLIILERKGHRGLSFLMCGLNIFLT